MENLRIRRYEARDRAAVRRICCDTGDRGEPVEHFFSDREIFADLITRYYTDLDSRQTWVVDCQGELVGYLMGCLDTRAYWRTLMGRILPAVVLRAIGRGTFLRAQTWRVLWAGARTSLLGGFRQGFHLAQYPAHLHINLCRPYRGRDTGRMLIEKFLEDARMAGVKGVHLVTRSDNPGACRFFERFGFEVLDRRPVVPMTVSGRDVHDVVIYGKML